MFIKLEEENKEGGLSLWLISKLAESGAIAFYSKAWSQDQIKLPYANRPGPPPRHPARASG